MHDACGFYQKKATRLSGFYLLLGLRRDPAKGTFLKKSSSGLFKKLYKLRTDEIISKVFVHLFQKVARCRDGVLTRSPQRSKYPGVGARLLFLVLFLFRKKGREKEQKPTIRINLNGDSVLLGLRPKPCLENFFGKKFLENLQKAL